MKRFTISLPENRWDWITIWNKIRRKWNDMFPHRIKCSFCTGKFWVSKGFRESVLGSFCSEKCWDRHCLDLSNMYSASQEDDDVP